MGFLGDTIGITGGFLGGVSDFASDIFTGGAYSNAQGQRETNAQNMAMADKQMAFQERMSNSAYQRAMSDMRAAGLNPMLTANNGGASTPTGSMATLQNPRPGDIGGGLMSTAKSLVGLKAEVANKDADTDLKEVQEEVAETQKQVNEATAAKATANAQESRVNAMLSAKQIERVHEDTQAARRDNEIGEAGKSGEINVAPAKAYLRILRDGIGAVGSGMGVLRGGGSYEGGSTTYDGSSGEIRKETWKRKGKW